MVINPFEWILLTGGILQALSAAVSSMSKPKKEDGIYAFWYRFLHLEINNVSSYFEHKYNIAMPRVVDETALQTVTTPESKIETAVTKTTTTAS
jgi:hypothetical protein